MCEMSYRDSMLLVHVGEERSFVIDAESEDSVLVWKRKGGAENGAVGSLGDRGESEPVERREHREFELQSVGRGRV